ncbi:phosphotransferase enzyme family protein [Ideonella sp. A 288]|uniref:phosphotransferase enzyme family protein n=1 Tax=Ideonella sp. A 288 TaxID=1962181 RepID=UPI001303E17D|nr:phosphotransferase [Ideonella sp. A 288]
MSRATVRGLDDAALHALLARHGLRAARWRVVATLDCTIVRIAPTRGSVVSLRIYPLSKTDLAGIDTELAWLAMLADDGLRVPRPLADRDGQRRHTLPDGRSSVLLGWVAGRLLDRALRPRHLRLVGRLIAGLHDAADRLAAAGGVRTERAADGPRLDDWSADRRPPAGLWTRRAQAVASATARSLIDEMAGWERTAASWGLVHGDMHLWNLLFAGRGDAAVAGAIDFSDCGIGWRALDLASTLQYLQHPLQGFADHRPHWPAWRDALFEGYAERRALWPGAERQVQALTAARWLNTVEWILDCWPRPDLRAFGPAVLADAPRLLGSVWPLATSSVHRTDARRARGPQSGP